MEAPGDSIAISASLSSPDAFSAVFDRHLDAIHGYLQRRVGRDLADELSSQTFLVAFDRRDRYDLSRPDAGPWLFGIATNLLRRHRRTEVRQLRAYARAARDPVTDPFEGAEERIDASEQRRLLVEALAGLPAEERDALLLYAWAELSYAEVADALDVPVGTVRSRLSRARARVREPLEAAGARNDCDPIPDRAR